MFIEIKNCGKYFVRLKNSKCVLSVCASRIESDGKYVYFFLGLDIALSLDADQIDSIHFLKSMLANTNDFFVGCF